MSHGLKSVGPSKEYLNALECYWSGRPQTAIERVSMLLAEDPDRSDRLQFYRLWVEILASTREAITLKSLAEHLHLVAVMHPSLAAPLMAVRGIAYLEVDDFAAAQLCYRAIKGQADCDYCDELKYRIAQRLSIRLVYSDLVARVNYLNDYFHLKTVAVLALQKNHKALLDSVGKRSLKLFSSSPLLNEIHMHKAADRRDWVQVANYAGELSKTFAGNMDYAFYSGYALAKQQLDAQAILTLERAISLGAEKDLDINNLLATLYARGAHRDESLGSRADHYHNKTEVLLEEQGMRVSTKISKEAPHAPRAWMIKLNAEEFFALRERRDSQLKSLSRIVDKDANIGDIVFLVGDDYKKQKGHSRQWRLAAVFVVQSEVQWHPIDGFVAELRLVSKLQSAIPFDVSLPKASGIDAAIIGLDLDSIDSITDAIKEYSDFDSGAVRVLENIEQTRMSS